MKYKSLVSLFLVIVMALSVCAVPASAAEAQETVSHSYAEEKASAGMIGQSSVTWEYDPETQKLRIGGTGTPLSFSSGDDQPWKDYREQILRVSFADNEGLRITDLKHWFEGFCEVVEIIIPKDVVESIEPEYFGDCDSLQYLMYGGENLIREPNVLSSGPGCALGACTCTSCTEVLYGYYPITSGYHGFYVRCSGNCGVSDFLSGPHSFSNNKCIYCGYTKNCSHSSTTTDWTGCIYTVVCTSCGAVLTSGTSHSYSYGSWSYYSATEHKRTGTCTDCGATTTSYGSHSTTTKYSQYSGAQHSVVHYCAACATNVGGTSYASHSFSYGAWSDYSDTQHRRLKTCASCSYSGYEYAAHVDSNGDGYCDACNHLMIRFSVTVPTSLAMAVSKRGKVNAASNAAIQNNSTGSVKITGMKVTTANGWKLVPYSSSLAGAKVNSKLLGFRAAGSETVTYGTSESMNVGNQTGIPKGGSLPLNYSAVVSAASKPINEQVLTVEFTVDWAA